MEEKGGRWAEFQGRFVNIGRHLLKGSVVSTVALVAQVVLAFVVTPLLVRALGERTYGMWILLMSVVGYYAFLDLGITSSVARFVAAAAGREDREEIHSVVNTAMGLFLWVGGICLVITLGLAIFAERLARSPGDVETLRSCVLIMGTLVAVGFPVRIFQGVLKAYLRYDLIAVGSLVKLVVANLLIWMVLPRGYGVVALAWITALAGLLESVLTVYFAWRAFPGLALGRRFVRKETRGSLLNYSWRSFVLALTQVIRFKVDTVVIASVLSVNLITHYSIGARFMDYFTELIGNLVGGQLVPVFSRYQGRGDEGMVRAGFLSASRVSTIVSVFCGGSLAFYGGAFIERWMGEGFKDSTTILLILVGPFTLALAQTPGVGLLYGMAKHHLLAWICGGAAVLNLGMSLILAKIYGMNGVAMGTSIELMVIFLLVFPVVVCGVAKVSLKEFFGWGLFWPAAQSVVPLGIYFLLVRQFLEPNYLRLGLLVIGQTVIFAPAVYWGVLSGEERAFLGTALRRKAAVA